MNYEVRKKENNRKKRKKYAASIPSLIYWKNHQAGFCTRFSSAPDVGTAAAKASASEAHPVPSVL